MRIRRPRECYHVVYFRGHFWEIVEGGNLPEGMVPINSYPSSSGYYPDWKNQPKWPHAIAVLSFFPRVLIASLVQGAMKPGWYAGVLSQDGSSTKVIDRHLGTHRRHALRWLRAKSRQLAKAKTFSDHGPIVVMKE